MGVNTLVERADTETITPDHFNDKRTALLNDLVPRNASGVPEDEAGSLGNTDFQWNDLRVKRILVDGVVLDPTPVEGRAYQIQSGKETAASGAPDFLSAAGVGNGLTADIAAATTSLVMLINNAEVSLTADQQYTGLTAAPSTNNTMLVNDTAISGSDDELTRGEIGNVPIAFDTVGSEIDTREGEVHAFLTANSEVVLARIGTITAGAGNIYPLKRGWAGTSRAAVANNDSWTLLQINTLLVKDDALTFVSSDEYPTSVDTSPALGNTGRIYFERSTRNQTYDDGTTVSSEYIVIGYAIADDTDCLWVEHFDFDLSWSKIIDVDYEIFDTTTIRIRRGSLLGIKSLSFEVFDDIDLDTTTDLDSGESLTASKDLFIYAKPDGNFTLSHVVPRPFDYFKGGRYHPLDYYRYVGSVEINASSEADYKATVVPSKEGLNDTYTRSRRVELDLDNDFSAGRVLVERIGNLVSITSLESSQDHASSSSPDTSVGFIPVWARPSATTVFSSNVFNVTSVSVLAVSVLDTGRLTVNIWDWAGVAKAQNSSQALNIQYSIED